MVDSLSPREMFAFLRDGKADVLLSGGRSQFIALKARTAWVDINQERSEPFAGYDGMIELVKKLDGAINNPVWEKARKPAPWDEVFVPSASLADHDLSRHRKKFASTEADDIGEC